MRGRMDSVRRLLAAFGVWAAATSKRPTSALLLAHIRAQSGAPVGRIIERSQLAAGTAYYHLARLEQEGQIRTIVAGRRRLVFLASDVALLQMDVQSLSLLSGATARTIAQALADHAPMSIIRLIAVVRESPRSVYYHVKRFKSAGLIETSAPRRYGDLTPTPKLRLLLSVVTAEDCSATDPVFETSQSSVE